MKRSLALIALLVHTVFCFSQICGTVEDQKGNHIESANVLLLSPDSVFVQGTISDAMGGFCFQMQKEGHYLLKITFVGYEDFCTPIQYVQNSGDLGAQILTPKEYLLDQVEVKGSPFLLTGNGIP